MFFISVYCSFKSFTYYYILIFEAYNTLKYKTSIYYVFYRLTKAKYDSF